MAAIVVSRRGLDWQVDQSEFFIHRDLSPHAGVARLRCGIVQPCVRTKLVRQRNRVKDPEALAGADVICADISLVIVVRLRRHPFPECSTGDHHVFGDNGRGVDPDLPINQINALIVLKLQIHRSIFSERGYEIAGFRI